MNLNKYLMVLLAGSFLSAGSLLSAGEEKAPAGENKTKGVEKEVRRVPPPRRHFDGRGSRRPGGPGGQFNRGARKGPGHFFARFTPEERAALRNLIRNKDHAGFRKKMQELRIKYASPEDRKVMDLRNAFHAAKTPGEKERIRKELRASIKVQMEKRLEFTKAQIRSAEEKLNRLKKFYEHNLAEKEKMVERRLDTLCKHPSESPMPPFHGKRVPPPLGGENR